MSGKAEKLQDAIGLIKDEYIEEAHADAASDEKGSPSNLPAEGNAEGKVVKMPPQKRRRKPAVPIAIAACLVLALGVGALAFTSLQKPEPEMAAESAEEMKTGETESLMTTDAVEADGAGDAATGSARTETALVPGQPGAGWRQEGEAFVLTGAEWNDNANWPFFMNLVNSGTIAFPSYGIDPTHRVKATVVDGAGNPLRNETVELRDEAGNVLWTAVSDKQGAAYLFYREGQVPASVVSNGVEQYLAVAIDEYADGQGGSARTAPVIGDATLVVNAAPVATAGLQVMFIVDTTGSMADEIAYLQKDFASIAGDVGSDGVEYSVNFYRDEGDNYVTKCNGFTGDVAKVQALLNAEYADGGGDAPEAVAQILTETITDNGAWRDDCNKVAFLIFDAPPHDGTDAVIDAAVRSAADRGIRVVPVVASNADRDTELFGRALAICTDGTYVFLTDDSGVGASHLEPIVGDYTVELLHDVIVRIIEDNR